MTPGATSTPTAPVHVLHVINNLPVGGAERFLVLLAAAQRRLGLRVEVCALSEPNPLAAELALRGVPFVGLGRARLNDPRLVFDLVRRLRAGRPDILHTHLFYADTVGRVAARLCGIHGVVGTEHSTEGAPLSRRRRAAMRWTAGSVRRLAAVSEPVRQAAAARLHIDPARIAVIPNGIELESWVHATPLTPAELGVPESALRVGSVGRLDDAKGYDVLIEAVARLADPRVHLLFAGDGPRRDELAALARARNVAAQVHWLGWRADVPRILAALHVFAMPSRWEGHSMALLEAMAAGCACVVSDIPELALTLGDAGERAKPGDPAALAGVLRRLLDDPARRLRLGQAARAAAASFSIETSASRYAALYAATLQAPAPGPR